MRRELVMLCVLMGGLLGSPMGSPMGTVVGITDGDTLTILKDGVQEKVRLVEIDAPEKSQAFGQRSKQSLSELCYGKSARVVEKDRDRWRRILGRVYCMGPQGEVDTSLEQVQKGMAWFYVKYGTDPAIKRAEDEARSKGIGLWSAPATPPWEFRKEKRDKENRGTSKRGTAKRASNKETAWH